MVFFLLRIFVIVVGNRNGNEYWNGYGNYFYKLELISVVCGLSYVKLILYGLWKEVVINYLKGFKKI